MAINSRLAYSTESGRIRTDQPKPAETAPADGVVKVRREKKGRGGKTVTTVSGVPVGAKELKGLASELKRQCASGGSVSGGIIEIQGDHVDRVMELLADRGYKVKQSGG
jgi:translation initiation factor 1